MFPGHSRKPRLKSLLNDLPPGFIVDTAWLTGRGIDARSIHNYVQKGWIRRVVRGVYQRPLPHRGETEKLSWQVVLLSLQQLTDYDVHLGGRHALDQFGFSHCLMMGKWQYIHFYGDAPPWLNRLPTIDKIILHRSTLFGGDPVGVIDHYYPEFNSGGSADVWQWPIRISSPERAILELIARLRRDSDFEYVAKYFESLTELRPELLMILLQACRSVKTKRLFFIYAGLYQHDWLKGLNTDQIDFGSGPRNLVPGGRFHPTYQISLPDFFSDFAYEDECIF